MVVSIVAGERSARLPSFSLPWINRSIGTFVLPLNTSSLTSGASRPTARAGREAASSVAGTARTDGPVRRPHDHVHEGTVVLNHCEAIATLTTIIKMEIVVRTPPHRITTELTLNSQVVGSVRPQQRAGRGQVCASLDVAGECSNCEWAPT
jgi:hypothetical protein